MRKIKVIISVFLVISIVLSCSLTVFGAEITTDYISKDYKIDSRLEEILAEADDNDIIPISVWFNDIDHEIIKDKVEEKMAPEIESGRISQEAIDLVFFDDLRSDISESQTDLSVYDDCKGLAESVSVEQAMEIISCERKVSSEIYSKYNSDHNFNIMKRLSMTDEVLSSHLLYSCRYAPNVEICLTKEQILNLVDDEEINYIYYLDPDDEICEDTVTEDIVENDNSLDELEETFDTTFYSVTGINTARDAWGLSGNGMKVGMLESGGVIDSSLVTTHTSQMHKVSSTSYSYSNHANTVAKLMVGYLDGYVGAIPNADLYYDKIEYTISGGLVVAHNVKQRMEETIDKEVTAINCSFSFKNEFNTYDDLARWYDHVSIQHNVHLILSSSNRGSTGVPYTNMSYNAIVVGNCDNNGNIATSSSYCNNDPLPYKPDLVAPGVGIYIIPNYPTSGTSFSAPLVTAAVIQLSQCSAVLLSNPRLMKSLLISSTKITNGMSNDPMYSNVGGDDIAYSRKYGAGLLYVPNAYVAFHDNSYYNVGELSKYSNSICFDRYLRRVSGKTIRICLAWDKKCTINGTHSTGTVNESNLDTIKLIVIDPNGTTYSSAYEYDNKQMISFVPQSNGYYQFKIERIYSSLSTNNNVNYSITWSVQP